MADAAGLLRRARRSMTPGQAQSSVLALGLVVAVLVQGLPPRDPAVAAGGPVSVRPPSVDGPAPEVVVPPVADGPALDQPVEAPPPPAADAGPVSVVAVVRDEVALPGWSDRE